MTNCKNWKRLQITILHESSFLVREFLWFFDLFRIFVLGLIIFGFYQSLSVVSNFIKNVHPFLFGRSHDEYIFPETSRENRIHVPFFPDLAVNAFRIIPCVHDAAGRFFRLVTSYQQQPCMSGVVYTVF